MQVISAGDKDSTATDAALKLVRKAGVKAECSLRAEANKAGPCCERCGRTCPSGAAASRISLNSRVIKLKQDVILHLPARISPLFFLQTSY